MANEISLSKQVSMVDNIVESVNEILSDAFIWLTFCDRDGTINIYDEELQELLEIIQELEELLVGAITGKLPEEASGPLSKMGAIFGGGTGLNLFTKSGKKIPFTISPEIIKEMEAVAKPIYEKYLGREVDLIKETLVQYNAYIEELNEGKIVLFSGNPAEREDYIGGNPRKSDPNLLVDLSHNPEARFGEETEVLPLNSSDDIFFQKFFSLCTFSDIIQNSGFKCFTIFYSSCII